jgi:hypothetical protein
MASSREKIAAEVQALRSQGAALLTLFIDEESGNVFKLAAEYQPWYTRALAVVQVLLPDRLGEFRRQYERNDKRKTLDPISYVIEDYLHGLQSPTDHLDMLRFQTKDAVLPKLNTQQQILSGCVSRLDDILANIQGVLQADLFDSELDAARHLLKNGHIRAAGAVTGVVLEGHLAHVCDNHGVKVPKKDPPINDFNEALKKAGVFDVTQWRGIQRLADIRNLCDHRKKRDPTPEEVEELIDGTDKAIKTLA